MAMLSCPMLGVGHKLALVEHIPLETSFAEIMNTLAHRGELGRKLGRHPRGWLAASGSQRCPARHSPQDLFSLLLPSQLGTTWLAVDFLQVLTAAALLRPSWLLGNSSQ